MVRPTARAAAKAAAAAAEAQAEVDRVDNRWAEGFWRRRFGRRRLLSDAKGAVTGGSGSPGGPGGSGGSGGSGMDEQTVRRQMLSDSSADSVKLGAVALLLRLDKPGQFPAAALTRSFDGGRTWGALEHRPPGVGAPVASATCAALLGRTE